MNNIVSQNTIRFVVLVLVQVLILNHINFLGYINPYLYILFIILYPVKNNRTLFIFLAFLLGLSVDIFSDSGGVHAASSVTLAYVRPGFLKWVFGALYEHQTIKFSSLAMTQKLSYFALATVAHNFILFSLEIFNFSRIILIFQKTLFSGIFTIILCILVTIIFTREDS